MAQDSSFDSAKPQAKRKKAGKALSETKNWYVDRHQYLVVQRNFMALVAMVMMGIALITSFAISQMTPMKSVKPFVIQVDDKTGITQVVNPLDTKDIKSEEALKQYFVAKYVRARESYDAALFEDNYEAVRVMTDPGMFEQYKNTIGPRNPDSPSNLYSTHTRRLVKLKSVTFINPTTAQVRVRIYTEGKIKTPDIHAIVWISFEFTNLDLTLEERYINPVGFRVTSYRVDEEILTQ